ncbi:Gfo/Idh/MocA family oxidoreductase [Termitidicoccus mucosus]|uniref:Oxidoreductase n=1 Tax=Termitidicoccus mucosus TaxID=1184151 RepID=A0A178IMT8_9BACT|nr:oxidoreductase [Opitutaceae bacterium TSB47]
MIIPQSHAPGPAGAKPLSRTSAPVRFAFVGTGGRVRTFLDPVPARFPAEAAIVGLCDASIVRARFHQKRLRERFGYGEVPVYQAADFGRMLRETRPDVVVVCTVDCEHDRYIIEALRAGCDAVTEKPMTTTAAKCAAILRAAGESERAVRVCFNYRWIPGATKVREILRDGVIGKVRHVTLEYLLNTSHGADYFRRWHSEKHNSGGLLVHKSTHHFDLVNWWIDAIPSEVFAHGALQFYGRENAIRRGDEAFTRYPRYYGQGPMSADPFAYDYSRSMIQDIPYEKAIYLGEAEKETGYVRDRNVFRNGIDIEDTMNVLVRYRDGTLLNYSLNAFSPYEGFRVAFNGDRGRVEYREFHGAHLAPDAGIGQEHAHAGRSELRVFPHFKPSYSVEVPVIHGAHGGSDDLLQEQIFSSTPPVDPFQRAAGPEQGAASILIGIAANESIATGKPVSVSSLVPLRPDAIRLGELR